MKNTLISNEITPLSTGFPYSPQGKRILANDLIRSALFTSSNHNKKRDFLKDEKIYCYGKSEIIYRGEELRQDDEDVFMLVSYGLSHFENADSENLSIEFLPYTFIKNLGWPQRPHYKEKLKEIFLRLSTTSLEVKNNELSEGLVVSLIRKFAYQDEKGDSLKKWKVWVEKEICQLFKKNCYSKIVWEQRLQLKPLGKWLHSFYSSHAEPYPINISTIHRACGSKAAKMKHFKADLRKALIDLVKVGFLEDFHIFSNKVNVVRVGKVKI